MQFIFRNTYSFTLFINSVWVKNLISAIMQLSISYIFPLICAMQIRFFKLQFFNHLIINQIDIIVTCHNTLRNRLCNLSKSMHLSFVPLTADGRLSAKEIVGNKKKLTQWQDKFWEHMVRKYPDLERGESASQTGREHIPPRVFKEMTRLLKQKAKLEELLAGIGAFNAKSRAAEIAAFMDQYIPAVERMYNLMKKYQVAFTETTMENKKLKQKNAQLEQSLEKATQESTLKQLADAKLRRDYADAVAVLDRIPKEVLDVYTRGSGRKERPIEQNL